MFSFFTSIPQLWRNYPAFFILVCVMMVAILPGVTHLPPMDRDEARYMQASRQMVETGDVITIRFQDELRAKKPAGIYWMQSASAWLFDKDTPASYRLPSVIGGFGIMLMTFLMASRMMPPMQATFAAAFIGLSLIIAAEARLAKTDAMLCMLIMVQQYALWIITTLHRQGKYVSGRYALMLWVSLALGVLVKGPIAPAILILTMLGVILLERHWRWVLATRPLMGLVVVTLMVLPWVLLVTAATNGAFLDIAIKGDFINKLQSGQESHGMPFGAHLIFLLIVFWPGSLIIARAIPGIWAHRKSPTTRFLLAWIIPFWLLIELTPTKLPHYSLPVLPALALLIAFFGLPAAPPSHPRWRNYSGQSSLGFAWHMIRSLFSPPVLITIYEYLVLVLGVVLGMLVFIAASLYGGSMIWGGLAFLMAVICSILGWFWRRNASRPVYLAAMLISAAGFHAVTFGGVLPGMSDLHLAPRIKAELVSKDLLDHQIAVAGYHEPSLVFALGQDILLFTPDQAAVFLAEAEDSIAIIEDKSAPLFLDILGNLNINVIQHGAIEGYNYSRGQPVRLVIYSRK